MTTTVQISKSTRQMLDRIKRKKKLSSFDQVISSLAREKINIPKSMFGVDKTLKFTQKDKVDLHEL